MTNSSGNKDIDRQLGGKPEEVVELLESLDGDVRSLALRELIARKERGVPALLAALEKGSADLRALAAEGLSTLADPSTADALAEAVKDKTEKVRSYAAVGLANIGDPRALDALVATLGDSEDVLHTPFTVSTYALARFGMGALPVVMPLLTANDEPTRVRARYIVKRILTEEGLVSDGSGLTKLLESYDPDDKPVERNEAAGELLDWLKKHPVKTHKTSKPPKDLGPDKSGL